MHVCTATTTIKEKNSNVYNEMMLQNNEEIIFKSRLMLETS